MKNLLLLLLFIPLISFTQTITYKEDTQGRTLAKNQYGKIIAIGQKDYMGNYIWKDPAGNIIKKETIDYLGGIISKDVYGNTISTKKKNYIGEIEEKDQAGNLIAKYRTNYMGEVEKVDPYGNIIGKYKSTYTGDIQFVKNTNLPSYTPRKSSGSYRNPKRITPVYSEPYKFSEEYYEAMGAILAKTLTGFGFYLGYNDGVNFGLDFLLGKQASYGLHFGYTEFPDTEYGNNIRMEYALNLGLYLTKRKNIILKTSWGFTDLDIDYDAYPYFNTQTFEEWEKGYNKWADKAYQKFYYKVGVQFALSKKNKGSGLSPEIYFSNNGIGIGLGYIINRKNSNYSD